MKEKKKFKVLKEGLGIDYYSLDNALFEQNILIARLREENETLKDKIEFLTNCLDDRDKSIELMKEKNKTLEEKYEKLKADYIKLSKIVEVGGGYRASYVNELRDKIAKLEQELKIWMLTAKDYARLQGVDLEDSPRL